MSTDYDHIAAVEKQLQKNMAQRQSRIHAQNGTRKKKKNTCNKCKNYILNKRKTKSQKRKLR